MVVARRSSRRLSRLASLTVLDQLAALCCSSSSPPSSRFDPHRLTSPRLLVRPALSRSSRYLSLLDSNSPACYTCCYPLNTARLPQLVPVSSLAPVLLQSS